ncbi:BQ5605_C007g04894 [Microbotryum silenes-dioicae]|uniref:BQ5605_C007g04894 protein n=1 Tax=Microbotryum silenes-dioicae TaxID=796604 RepID=A0A2X0MCD5_9BASI|nr:BQ5605_C007g04894 [Microbotryum silenes-dioicae]
MGFPFRKSRAPNPRASFFASTSRKSVPCDIWQWPIYTVDFSSARAIDRAPRFDGFWRVPPFRVEKVDFSSARAIDRAPRFDGFAEKVDFSSARAIDRAPRFDGFWLVPPFRVEKVDFSSARAIDRAPRFDGFWRVPPFRVEKVDFSSARAIDRALSIFIFTGNLWFYSKTYPGIGLYPTYDTYILNLPNQVGHTFVCDRFPPTFKRCM